jgi:quercetin dioxygenase-like cupin family protein
MDDQIMLTPKILLPGDGPAFDWMNDNMFIKLSSAETGGLCTLIEDNIRPGFALGMHLHRQHTEIFYILEGEIEFTVDGQHLLAMPGTTIYIPPGTPHAARSDQPGKMLMLYTPGGFEGALIEYSRLAPEQFSDQALMQSIADRYDIVSLSDKPAADPA